MPELVQAVHALRRCRPQVLWLSDNYISTISDLGTLTRLRDLNLARNDIAVIGDSLLANTALETLNLADNAIGSFKVGHQTLA